MATATIFDQLLNQQRSATAALAGGTVTFYAAGTTSKKAIWLDNLQSEESANPVTLDSRGTAVLYGSGNYKLVLKDADGVTVATWDNYYAGADLSSIDLSTIIASASFSNRDFIGNSRFNIWNNGTSFTRTTVVDTLTADGWYYRADGTAGTVVISRNSFTYGQTDVAGNPLYYTKVNRSGASSGSTSETFAFRMPIETAATEEMTFRFNAKAAGATNVTVVCTQYFGTGGSPTVVTTSAAIGVTTSWQRLSKTFTVPTIASMTVGAGAYMEIGISFTPGSTYNVDIAMCKFEMGTVAGDDEPRTSYEDDIRTTGKIASTNFFNFVEVTEGTDEKYWKMYMDTSADSIVIAALDDSQANPQKVLEATRNGNSITEVTLSSATKSVTLTEMSDVVANAARATGDTYTGTHNFTGATTNVATPDIADDSSKAAPTSWVVDKIASAELSTVLPNLTGNAGKVPKVNSTETEIEFKAIPLVTDFPSNGSWDKPDNAILVTVELWGPGGGGGSGRKGSIGGGSSAGGGTGGGGGSFVTKTFLASELSDTVNVAIGAGGIGGASQTTNDTNGNAGSNGGNTTFGSYLTAYGGKGGSGGSTGSATGGAPSSPIGTTINTSSAVLDSFCGAAGGNSNVNSAAAGASSLLGGPGGGSGGYLSSGTPNNGASGGVSINSTGGNGSNASATTDSAAGGNGSDKGGGGGGSGATDTGHNTGVGGTGGNGYARITVW